MNPSNLSLRQKSRGTVVKTIAIHLYGARDPNYIVDLTLSNLLWTLVDFLGILCVSNHVTHAYAHAHFSNKRVIRELRIVSCPGGGVWVAVTREFERDNCVISEILQSDWTIPNRAGVPRNRQTVFPRVGGAVWARD